MKDHSGKSWSNGTVSIELVATAARGTEFEATVRIKSRSRRPAIVSFSRLHLSFDPVHPGRAVRGVTTTAQGSRVRSILIGSNADTVRTFSGQNVYAAGYQGKRIYAMLAFRVGTDLAIMRSATVVRP